MAQTYLSDQLSTTFAALADPTRRAILARLALGETSVTELAEPFRMSMPAVSKHLKVLERASLITRGREAQWRPCRLRPAPLKDIAGWVEHYRKFWEQSFDRLEGYLHELKDEEKKRARRKARSAGGSAKTSAQRFSKKDSARKNRQSKREELHVTKPKH